jgi:DNA-directed RNA polymerase specialized sigma24 family protein
MSSNDTLHQTWNKNYYDVANYAVAKGINSSKRLARYDSPAQLRKIVDGWVGETDHQPVLKGLPLVVDDAWEPCSHWNHTRVTQSKRLCPTCQRVQFEAYAEKVEGGPQLKTHAGCMRAAEDMWLDEKNKKIVRRTVRQACRKYTGGKAYEQLDDLVQQVWDNVLKRIGGYKDQGLKHGPVAWLKSVAYSTVIDWFKGEYRLCRDVRKNVPLSSTEFDRRDLPARSTPKASDLNGESEDDEDDSAVSERKAAYDKALGQEWEDAGINTVAH